MITLDPHKPLRGHLPPPGTRGALSVDPGIDTGWALWSWPEVVLVGAGVGRPPVERACRLAIEKPQVYPRSPVPPNDLITLALKAGRYIGAFESPGLEAVTVLPHEWKGNLPKDICEARVRKHLSVGELALVATGAGVPMSLQNNMWDAIGIGLHVWRRVRL